jgi:hypothetical protein
MSLKKGNTGIFICGSKNKESIYISGDFSPNTHNIFMLSPCSASAKITGRREGPW